MGENKINKELLEELQLVADKLEKDVAHRTTRIRVNKRTHRVKFENESEDAVEVVIEPKDKEGI